MTVMLAGGVFLALPGVVRSLTGDASKMLLGVG